jgi:hypothetical protein
MGGDSVQYKTSIISNVLVLPFIRLLVSSER